ncbi:ring-1,2-phenylacetyl-CoA epoxidase subunit PaaC [Actinoplanes lutulentus]|uniref:Ring-1,2-phenylacetyl-CoA epoxidase subunit PaaC n=1 Tax=Actinoplanes lutulentus TaxID=1287878 RepID=A0A327YZQ1_9ACTN|nr:1,2-phenylacetyl-CoA epoxidase subunit PaaC [Actinoplanes lutulentus]MBB2943530.1 ring-1,2-phenylacetyl-CoA epoxidase subunit PaaC [Actinoplanes lutulentus]RAK27396.1 ring-1,2-phenylacetyl-CoA epoxidase subunit PaaC [Actinoplanes lutulentus]
MAFDDAYSALTDHDDDARWAYGTGFSDPLASVPSSVPADVDGADLSLYCLMLGDDALILSHRLQEWVTRAPELEDELALANIALDLLGQARLLLSRAGVASGASSLAAVEDVLAFGRDAAEFRNVRLAERSDADFACLVGRLLVMVTWRLAAFDRLASSRDPMLAAIAAKGVKELTYHRDYAAQWVVRLGDGTALSHSRMAAAMAELLPLTGELFATHPVEARLAVAGVAVEPVSLRAEFDGVMAQVLEAATLDPVLPGPPVAASGEGAGRDGVHGPELDEILREMQSVARAVPGGVW